jgi:hypothetical protein
MRGKKPTALVTENILARLDIMRLEKNRALARGYTLRHGHAKKVIAVNDIDLFFAETGGHLCPLRQAGQRYGMVASRQWPKHARDEINRSKAFLGDSNEKPIIRDNVGRCILE